MNQRGDMPMDSMRFRIPTELLQKVEEKAHAANVTKSEFVRLCVEYVLQENIELVKKVYLIRQD